jgi:catechol 2,3-dioxygenase-like lactoylglutathione lyase family enzyme
MLKTANVMCFVATTQPAKAKSFYKNTLGLRLLSEDSFALAFDANGIMLRVQKVESLQPARFTVLGWAVSDIAVAVSELGAKGVTFAEYPGLSQDSRGIWQAPSGARVAWFADPDGNTLSLTQLASP